MDRREDGDCEENEVVVVGAGPVARSSDLAWTILQPSMFAQIVLSTCAKAPAGSVNNPFNVHRQFSLIHLRDLAEAAVRVLSDQGHDSATYELAGPAVTLAGAVRVAGHARGVELEARTVGWRETPLLPGIADSQASGMRAMWQDCDRHGLRGNSNVLGMLLGREPTSFEQAAVAFVEQG